MRPPRRADAAVAAAITRAGPPGSLRARARQLGVSHEAVRQAMIAAGTPTDLDARNARIRSMVEQDIPWPTIAAAVGLSPSAVRRVCRDMPPRRAGPKPRGRPSVGT
jgi:hypothetical protein